MPFKPIKASAAQLSEINLQDRHDIENLIKLININKNLMVEIGTLYGMSTKIFSRHFKHVTTIDPYLAGYDNIDPNSNPAKIALAEQVFHLRFYDEPNVDLIKRSSHEAVDSFLDKSLDLVYIDGNHKENIIKRDIAIWIRKIKTNGYIAGHDINRESVKNAVEFHFKNNYSISDYNWIIKL